MNFMLDLLLALCPPVKPAPPVLEEWEVLPVYDSPDDWRRSLEGR